MLGDFGPDGLQFRQLAGFDPRLEGGRRVKVESGRYFCKVPPLDDCLGSASFYFPLAFMAATPQFETYGSAALGLSLIVLPEACISAMQS